MEAFCKLIQNTNPYDVRKYFLVELFQEISKKSKMGKLYGRCFEIFVLFFSSGVKIFS